jgi:hypothetical protein
MIDAMQIESKRKDGSRQKHATQAKVWQAIAREMDDLHTPSILYINKITTRRSCKEAVQKKTKKNKKNKKNKINRTFNRITTPISKIQCRHTLDMSTARQIRTNSTRQ